MTNYRVKEEKLYVSNKILRFNYSIYEVVKFEDLIIVLLEFKNHYNPSDFINAVYAVNYEGQIIWEMEDPRGYDPKYIPDPIVGLNIIDNKIQVTDYSSRKYILDKHNGKILRAWQGDGDSTLVISYKLLTGPSLLW